jgi:succinoglycan biosynthesis transport protein ExoP
VYESEDQKRETAELADYLRVIRERAIVIILVTVILVALALIMSFRSTPLYSASSKLVYKTNTLDQALFGAQIFSNANQPRDVETGAELIKLGEVAVAAKKELNSPRSAGELLSMISVTPSTTTNIIQIEAVSADPSEAAGVANAFAEQFVAIRQNADRTTVAAARQLVKNQLDSLTSADASSAYGLMLKDKYESLQILEAMQTGGFSVVQSAVSPSGPFSPRPTRSAILALAVGLVFGLGLAFLLNYLDRRIKDVKGLERVFGLPVLAAVPAVGGRWKSRDGAKRSLSPVGFVSHHSLLESFRTLRSSLQYFAVEKSIKTILVTSGLPREGKTVTAVNLALSLVLAGHRVIILEADLRRPMIPHYLGVNNTVGLSTLLAGATTLGDALQLVNLETLLPQEVREKANRVNGVPLEKSLLCLASGPLPPNPAELLGSDRMEKLLEELSLNPGVGYVIIDTPPVLSIADALVIASKVDAVVIASRVNWTTRDEAEEVSSRLRRSGARVIGVVAGGVKTGSSYYGRRGYRPYGPYG